MLIIPNTVATALLACLALAGERPNILLILADDLGYADLGLARRVLFWER